MQIHKESGIGEQFQKRYSSKQLRNVESLPTKDLSGGGGTIRPCRMCFSFSLSWRPRKSLNLRLTENSEALNEGIDVYDKV